MERGRAGTVSSEDVTQVGSSTGPSWHKAGVGDQSVLFTWWVESWACSSSSTSLLHLIRTEGSVGKNALENPLTCPCRIEQGQSQRGTEPCLGHMAWGTELGLEWGSCPGQHPALLHPRLSCPCWCLRQGLATCARGNRGSKWQCQAFKVPEAPGPQPQLVGREARSTVQGLQV